MKKFWRNYNGWILTILLLIAILIAAKFVQIKINELLFPDSNEQEQWYDDLQPYEWVD